MMRTMSATPASRHTKRTLLAACLLFGAAAAASRFSAMPPPPSPPAPSLSAEAPSALGRVLDRSFGNRSGAAVAADVSSGKILAARNLQAASRRLALPGSTLKTFTLITLLESGKIRPSETFVCPYKLEIAGHRLDCPHPQNLGPLDPASWLAYSCNNFFAHMAERLTPEELAHGLSGWGFSSPTHLAAGEASGEIVVAHSTSELELQAIGEFGIHVTPLELLQGFRRIAQRRRGPAPLPEALKIAIAGLESGVDYGMAAGAKVPGLSVAGKTGTSLADEGNWTHGWFAGYAPAEAPEIVLVIFLERGRGPTDAAGIAHNVFAAYRDARGHP